MTGLPIHLNRRLLAEYIRANCGPITLAVEDMIECLGYEAWHHEAGVDDHACRRVIARKIQEGADLALARTLGQDRQP